jgi:hypothetical protein
MFLSYSNTFSTEQPLKESKQTIRSHPSPGWNCPHLPWHRDPAGQVQLNINFGHFPYEILCSNHICLLLTLDCTTTGSLLNFSPYAHRHFTSNSSVFLVWLSPCLSSLDIDLQLAFVNHSK